MQSRSAVKNYSGPGSQDFSERARDMDQFVLEERETQPGIPAKRRGSRSDCYVRHMEKRSHNAGQTGSSDCHAIANHPEGKHPMAYLCSCMTEGGLAGMAVT